MNGTNIYTLSKTEGEWGWELGKKECGRIRTRRKRKTFKQEKLWRCENIFEYAGEITSRMGYSHKCEKIGML